MRVIREVSDSAIKQYNVVIHLPAYDDPDDEWMNSMAYTTIVTPAESEEDARAMGKRYIKNKQKSTMSKFWTNAEVISVVDAGEHE